MLVVACFPLVQGFKVPASWTHSKRFATANPQRPPDAHWGHEPSPASHRFKAFMDETKAILGCFESLGAIPRFMSRARLIFIYMVTTYWLSTARKARYSSSASSGPAVVFTISSRKISRQRARIRVTAIFIAAGVVSWLAAASA